MHAILRTNHEIEQKTNHFRSKIVRTYGQQNGRIDYLNGFVLVTQVLNVLTTSFTTSLQSRRPWLLWVDVRHVKVRTNNKSVESVNSSQTTYLFKSSFRSVLKGQKLNKWQPSTGACKQSILMGPEKFTWSDNQRTRFLGNSNAKRA